MGAPGQDRSVDAVGGEESKDVSFFPVKDGLETFSECEGGFFQTLVGVVAPGVGILVDDWTGQQGSDRKIDRKEALLLSSGNGLSLRSKRKSQMSTSGMLTGGYEEATGMVKCGD